MKLSYALKAVAALGIVLQMVACGGENDPIAKEINESLDVDIERFDTDQKNVYPGDTLKIRWRSSGAFIFDAKVYLSEDTRVSADDFLIIDEDCSPSGGDHCEAGNTVIFECRFKSDNTFNCEEDDDNISQNDLTTFLDQIPKSTYLILELCNDNDCEIRSKRITFY